MHCHVPKMLETLNLSMTRKNIYIHIHSKYLNLYNSDLLTFDTMIIIKVSNI